MHDQYHLYYLYFRGSTPLPYIKPPNKHKYNQNLEELQSVISQLEATKTTQVENLRTARENQRRLRDEREATNQRKDAVFHQLDLLNDQVQMKIYLKLTPNFNILIKYSLIQVLKNYTYMTSIYEWQLSLLKSSM